MELSTSRSSRKAGAVWVVGVATTTFLWLIMTPWTFSSSSGLRIIAIIFAFPVIVSAGLWQSRLRREYLDGYLPTRWSRTSLFRMMGEKATIGQRVMFFQIAASGYLISTVSYRLPIILFPLTLIIHNVGFLIAVATFLSVVFSGIVAGLVGDAFAVYLLTEHKRGGIRLQRS